MGYGSARGTMAMAAKKIIKNRATTPLSKRSMPKGKRVAGQVGPKKTAYQDLNG